MALRISKPERSIPFEEYAAYLSERRAEVGPLHVPRNAGDRRTESKRALLKAIEELGGKW